MGSMLNKLPVPLSAQSVPELCFICYNGINRKVTGAHCAPYGISNCSLLIASTPHSYLLTTLPLSANYVAQTLEDSTMKHSAQDILTYVEDNDVKFVRLAF